MTTRFTDRRTLVYQTMSFLPWYPISAAPRDPFEVQQERIDQICQHYHKDGDQKISLMHTALFLSRPISTRLHLWARACLQVHTKYESSRYAAALIDILIVCEGFMESGSIGNALQYAFAVAEHEAPHLFNVEHWSYPRVIALGVLIFLCERTVARQYVMLLGFKEDQAPHPGSWADVVLANENQILFVRSRSQTTIIGSRRHPYGLHIDSSKFRGTIIARFFRVMGLDWPDTTQEWP